MSQQYSKNFKQAAISLFLEIIQKITPKNKQKYYKFFQNELKLTVEEFESIKSKIHDPDIDKEINVIKNELGLKQYEIMHFLMKINRCIILDGCELDSYQKFEKIRDKFLS